MIRYALRCPSDHRFESWFASAEAFESLRISGHLECVVCGATGVEKAMMAPRIGTTRAAPPAKAAPPETVAEPEALARLKARVEAEADYVGPRFARTARAIRAGEEPERAIYGEATGGEVKGLLEDGIPVAPLPFVPTRKAN